MDAGAERRAGARGDDRGLPLCVDLDGTLVATDTLWESLLACARRSPWRLLALPFWLAGGRAGVKARLAAAALPDVATLPYRSDVVAYAREARTAGRRVVLATASDRAIARAVADELGCFDEVIASGDGHNLKGPRKCEALVRAFGAGGFEYLGDSPADRAVWARAGRASCVGLAAGERARVGETTPLGRAFEKPAADALTWARTLRVHQWVKNILVFLPVVMSHRIAEPPLLLAGGVAFLALSLCASAIYLVNDLIDLPDDRAHPTKSTRPLAAGVVPLWAGALLAPLLLLVGGGLALWLLPGRFAAALALYVAVAVLYTFDLKRRAIVDVMVLAGLYSLRVLLGGLATGIPVSPWLIGFSLFFFLSLAFLKRYADLRLLAGSSPGQAPGRDYDQSDAPLLLALGPASGLMATLVLALYVQSDYVVRLYRSPVLLFLLVPLIVFWVSRMWRIAHRGAMRDDPVLFTVRDPVSYGVAVAGAAVLTAATFL